MLKIRTGIGCLTLSALLITAASGCGSVKTDVMKTADPAVIRVTEEEQAVYQTDIVTRGDFIRTNNFDGVLYYPELSQISYEGERAVLTEWLVSQGSQVKKGDPVASIQVEYDKVTLEEMELSLERLKSDYEWKKEQMSEGLETLNTETNAAELQYRKAEKELELYCLSMEQQIGEQEERIRIFREQISVTSLTAPMDGIVSELPYLKSGEYIPQGENLMTVYNPDVVWLKVTDVSAALRYNMEVTIETGNARKRTVMHGRVVSADNILPDALRRGYAYVEITDMPEDVNWSNTFVKADMVSAGQVLLVNRLAVESDGGSSFVWLLEDGTPHKRQVIRAGQGTDTSWILMGLEEGQELVIGQ